MTSESNTLGSVDATTAILEAELPRLEEHQQDLERKLATVTERLESVRAALGALRVLSAAPPVTLAVVTEDKSPAVLVPAARKETEVESKPEPTSKPEPVPDLVSAEETVAAPTRPRATKSTAPRATAKAPKSPKSPSTPGAAAKRKQKAMEEAAPAADKPATAKSRRATAGKSKAAATGHKTGNKKSVPAAPAGDNGNLTAQVMAVVNASGSTPVRARDVAEVLGRELTTGSINTVRSTLDRLVATSRAHRAGRGLYQAPLN